MDKTEAPIIKYYFCEDINEDESRRRFPKFIITPKGYFDRTGLVYDSTYFDPQIPGFQRVADSTFDFVDDVATNPVDVLLKHGEFMWRDMLTEITYAYRRRRLLGLS